MKQPKLRLSIIIPPSAHFLMQLKFNCRSTQQNKKPVHMLRRHETAIMAFVPGGANKRKKPRWVSVLGLECILLRSGNPGVQLHRIKGCKLCQFCRSTRDMIPSPSPKLMQYIVSRPIFNSIGDGKSRTNATSYVGLIGRDRPKVGLVDYLK